MRLLVGALVLSLLGTGALAVAGDWQPLARGMQECVDPVPGGGQLDFTFFGIATENHFASREAEVCPGQTEEWIFTTFGTESGTYVFDEYIGLRVVTESGEVAVLAALPDGNEVSLSDGEEYREIWYSRTYGDATYRVSVTGLGAGLTSYRIEACRGAIQISGPCVFEPRGIIGVTSEVVTLPPNGGGPDNGRPWFKVSGALVAFGLAVLIGSSALVWWRQPA